MKYKKALNSIETHLIFQIWDILEMVEGDCFEQISLVQAILRFW